MTRMRLALFLFSLFLVSAFTVFVQADFTVVQSQTVSTAVGPSNGVDEIGDGHQIKGMMTLREGSGVVFTSSVMLHTNDGGRTWREFSLPKLPEESIAGAVFQTVRRGFVAVSGRRNGSVSVLSTMDGGESWQRREVPLRDFDKEELSGDRIELQAEGPSLRMTLRLTSSTNFSHTSVYVSSDSGISWKHLESDSVPSGGDPETMSAKSRSFDKASLGLREGEEVLAESSVRRSKWILTNEGVCEGFKESCLQISRVYDISTGSTIEITPIDIVQVTEQARARARFNQTMEMLLPPGGSTRISLNKGFDKCTAATTSQMQTWWNSSPYYDVNIYMSGRNRGCTQAQLSANWVNTVSNQGWGLIPTVVGYQSPCSSCTTCTKHSTDPVQAEADGRGEADIAVTDATSLGLLQGTVLYYDMERYDDTSGTGACSTPTKAFLKGWTDRLKERGYVSGAYGSPTNAVNDWLNIPQASRMDAVWLARWDNIVSVWVYSSPSPVVPDTAWSSHQRIKQYQSPGNVTYGGVTFGIDNNIADGPVAGVQARNQRADFDGDGKSDVSVFRPDNDVWYVLNSSDSVFRAMAFGVSTDIMTPGDFDGDGRTDFAVWRPSDGVWHMYSRSLYTSYQFGSPGDVPVPADYDGDGRTDIAVYRRSNGFWYIKNSFDSRGTSFRYEQFGIGEDVPLPADFDGDGKADLAVFRPSNGVWYSMGSRSGFRAVQFGFGTDKPVPADFDGDAKTDIAVYRNGFWHILGTQAGYFGFPFGLSDDTPAPGDFDGDGKADATVFRPGNGVWYILGSSRGFFGIQFGLSSDRPVPTAYLTRN